MDVGVGLPKRLKNPNPEVEALKQRLEEKEQKLKNAEQMIGKMQTMISVMQKMIKEMQKEMDERLQTSNETAYEFGLMTLRAEMAEQKLKRMEDKYGKWPTEPPAS